MVSLGHNVLTVHEEREGYRFIFVEKLYVTTGKTITQGYFWYQLIIYRLLLVNMMDADASVPLVPYQIHENVLEIIE